MPKKRSVVIPFNKLKELSRQNIEDGKSLNKIALENNTTYKTLLLRFREVGLNYKLQEIEDTKYLSGEKKNKLIEEYEKTYPPPTIQELSNKFYCSKTAILDCLKLHYGRTLVNPNKIFDTKKEEAIRKNIQPIISKFRKEFAKATREIAKEENIHIGTAREILRRSGINIQVRNTKKGEILCKKK
jgi:hypothetical protein